MTQDEQDLATGRNLRERKELKQKIVVLRAKAARYGSFLKVLGANLESRPEMVAFEGASTGADSMENVHWSEVALYPQFQDIVATGNEIRETIALLKRKEEEAIRLNI